MMASYPDISFVIEEKKYVLTAKDYILILNGTDDVTYCVSNFAGLAIDNYYDWVLGPAFMGK